MKISPCKDCGEREAGCHAHCQPYIQWAEEKKENPPPDTGNSGRDLHAKRDIAENLLAEQEKRQEVTNYVKQSGTDGQDGC